MPEGGFIANGDGSSEFDPANVENNKSILMTYAEYKALEKKESSLPYPELSVMTRSASPDRAVNNPKILSTNEYYRSADFSGKGWRFSNIKFRAADGMGTWLRWTAIGDGGCVGNEYEAYQTYKSGQAISRKGLAKGQVAYVDGKGSWLFYYTYDPVAGSGYLVENK